VRPRPDPRRWLVLAHLEDAPVASTFDPTHHRAAKALASVASAKSIEAPEGVTSSTAGGRVGAQLCHSHYETERAVRGTARSMPVLLGAGGMAGVARGRASGPARTQALLAPYIGGDEVLAGERARRRCQEQ
jgi:hypothetical protein